MKYTALIFLIAFLFCSAGKVSADSPLPDNPHLLSEVKVNSHLENKPPQTCHNFKDNGWIVELQYYLDGDTPQEIAYSDYMDDFSHYFSQYPGTCKTAPETLN